MLEQERQTELQRTIARIDDLVLSKNSYFPDGNIKPWASKKIRDLGQKLSQLDRGDDVSYTHRRRNHQTTRA